MAKRKTLEPEPSNQSRRFIEAARKLGCDGEEATFDETLKKVASAPPPKSVEKRKAKKAAKEG